VLAELDRHPNARALLAPVFAAAGRPSHAYLFYGPGGSGKRAAASAVAAELLAAGSRDPEGTRRRVSSRAHPDLTWVAPSGAHEILVSDIDGPVVAAASRTPFEASRRVFVIERVDELGDEAANRMLKTLEEPAPFVHMILLTDRLVEVLPTIRSRCQLIRFDALPPQTVAAKLEALGSDRQAAIACARLSLGDGDRAHELATAQGTTLRSAAEQYASSVLAGAAAADKPWAALLAAVRTRGDATRSEFESRAAQELELYPRKERKRIETGWSERIRRARRRVETQTLDLGLQLVSLWFADLMCLSWGAQDVVRHTDRMEQLVAQVGVQPRRLRAAIELVENARQRFQLNVSEELACEALAYGLEHVLRS